MEVSPQSNYETQSMPALQTIRLAREKIIRHQTLEKDKGEDMMTDEKIKEFYQKQSSKFVSSMIAAKVFAPEYKTEWHLHNFEDLIAKKLWNAHLRGRIVEQRKTTA